MYMFVICFVDSKQIYLWNDLLTWAGGEGANIIYIIPSREEQKFDSSKI
jgi:hypothetical protein